ncbi:hypothetical protein AB0B45_10260 [Nonomuraea sp. NPDC049152]|uniref:hypothetical protein n=1 Tax=Nonomuraea sp. NPDC049152 TaxID=3154350 RepID=UPI0033C1A80B
MATRRGSGPAVPTRPTPATWRAGFRGNIIETGAESYRPAQARAQATASTTAKKAAAGS